MGSNNSIEVASQVTDDTLLLLKKCFVDFFLFELLMEVRIYRKNQEKPSTSKNVDIENQICP